MFPVTPRLNDLLKFGSRLHPEHQLATVASIDQHEFDRPRFLVFLRHGVRLERTVECRRRARFSPHGFVGAPRKHSKAEKDRASGSALRQKQRIGVSILVGAGGTRHAPQQKRSRVEGRRHVQHSDTAPERPRHVSMLPGASPVGLSPGRPRVQNRRVWFSRENQIDPQRVPNQSPDPPLPLQQPDRPIVCAPCTATALRPRRWTLQRLGAAHAQAKADLERALATRNRSPLEKGVGDSGQKDANDFFAIDEAAKRDTHVSAFDLTLRRERINREKAQLERLRLEVVKRKKEVETKKSMVVSRADTLNAATEKLKQTKTNLFEEKTSPDSGITQESFPERTRALALKLRSLEDELLRIRCQKLGELKKLLPIVAEAPEVTETNRCFLGLGKGHRSRGRGGRDDTKSSTSKSPQQADTTVPTAVRICGYRVPDPNDACEFRAEELSSGLGCVLLFLNVAGEILEVPGLMKSEGAGSSKAVIWQADSFWDDKPGSVGSSNGSSNGSNPGTSGTKFPLFLPQVVVEANGGGDAQGSPHERKRDDTRDAGALGTLLLETVNSGVSKIASNVLHTSKSLDSKTGEPEKKNPACPLLLQKRRQELQRAVGMLHKLVGVTCVELEVMLNVNAPSNWGPFASLAFYATEAARRAREDASSSDKLSDTNSTSTKRASNPFCDLYELGEIKESIGEGGKGIGQKNSSRGKKKKFKKALGALAASGANGTGLVQNLGQSLMTSVFGMAKQSSRRVNSKSGVRETPQSSWASDASVADLRDDGWDLVDVPNGTRSGLAVTQPLASLRETHSGPKKSNTPTMLPPPPSRPEDVEHWTRAMYVDAKR